MPFLEFRFESRSLRLILFSIVELQKYKYKIMIQEKAEKGMIYTFAPNWFRSQCVMFDGGHMFYASNYILYKYELERRRVVDEICLRRVLMQKGIKCKDIKIHVLLKVDKGRMLVGFNNEMMVMVQMGMGMRTLNVMRVQKIQNTDSMLYVEQQRMLLLSNEKGRIYGLQYDSNNMQIRYKKQIKENENKRVKSMFRHSQGMIVVYGVGEIQIMNDDKVLTHVSVQEYIISCDLLGNTLAILSKQKNNSLYINCYKVDEHKLQLVGRAQYKVTYPKSLYEKVKANLKSAITIKIINHNQLIVTGKLGQIFTIRYSQIHNHNHVLNIKPHSLQEECEHVRIWDDSKHYKEIYAIYIHQHALYANSTDQNMSVWNMSKEIPKHQYSIKFNTSSTASIFSCEADPKVMFILLRDSIIRSSVPLGEGAYYLNEYWKYTKKFKIVKAICHPCELGVVGMITVCGKVIVYDVYEDRLMKIIQLPKQEIVNISYELMSIQQPIQKLYNSRSEQGEKWQKVEGNIKVNTYFNKQLDSNYLLFIQLKNRFVSVGKEMHSFVRKQKIQRIHNTKHWNQHILLSTKKEKNMLNIHVYVQGVMGEHKLKLKYDAGKHIFKCTHNANYIYVIQYKAKKVSVTVLNITKEGDKLCVSVGQQQQVVIQVYIDEMVLDYWSQNMAIYNQKDDVMQIMSIGQLLKGRQKYQVYVFNSKIQTLAFYLQKYLIIGSKDQAIKVIGIKDLQVSNGQGKKMKKYESSKKKEVRESVQSKQVQQNSKQI